MKIIEKALSTLKRKREIRDLGYIPYKNTDAERDLSRVYLSWPKTR